jgi:hypothetical protein
MNAIPNKERHTNKYSTFPLTQWRRALLGVFGLWFLFGAGAVLGTDLSTNAPAHWPTLKEVLVKWKDTPLEAIERAAENNDLTAQHYLGYCYSEGYRFQQESQKGVAWYERAGKAGYLPSYSNLGGLYERGQGVSQDPAKMLYYYRLAADGGFAGAQLIMGYLYWKGTTVPQDQGLGLIWIQRAADQGNATAECELGYNTNTAISRECRIRGSICRRPLSGTSSPPRKINRAPNITSAVAISLGKGWNRMSSMAWI